MTPQQIARLEKQLQQNHVDIQRLWKAAFTKPEPYVGIPMAAVPGGLTTDTTDTTSTTGTTTTGTTTTQPPGPCVDTIRGTYEISGVDLTFGGASIRIGHGECDPECESLPSGPFVVSSYGPIITIGYDGCSAGDGYEYTIQGGGSGALLITPYQDCSLVVRLVARHQWVQCYYALFDSFPVGSSKVLTKGGPTGCGGFLPSPIEYCFPPDVLLAKRLS